MCLDQRWHRPEADQAAEHTQRAACVDEPVCHGHKHQDEAADTDNDTNTMQLLAELNRVGILRSNRFPTVYMANMPSSVPQPSPSLINYTWRSTGAFTATFPELAIPNGQPYTTQVAAGETGFIVNVNNNRTAMKVRLMSRRNQPIVQLPWNSPWEAGTLLKKDGEAWDVETGRPVATRTLAPPTMTDGVASSRSLQDPVASFLTGIRQHRAQIPGMPEQTEFMKMFASPGDVKRLTQLVCQNIANANPALPDKLLDAAKLSDITALCPDITNKLPAIPGVYLAVFSDFKPGTEFYGQDPRCYVGESGDIQNRWIAGHWTHMKNEENNETKYRCGRAARKIKIYLIARQPDKAQGGGNKIGEAIRKVTEQVMIVAIRSQSPKILEWQEDVTDQQNVAQAVAQSFSMHEVGNLLASLSEQAWKDHGYTIPKTEGRLDFGTGPGLNFNSPIAEDAGWVQTLYVMQDAGDRYIFHRKPLKAPAATQQNYYYQLRLLAIGTGDMIFRATISDQGKAYTDETQGPLPGDLYYASVEIMKSGKHQVPHFRLKEIGCWSNWDYVNRIAIKVKWRSKATGKWYQKMLQRGNMTSSTQGGKAQNKAQLFAKPWGDGCVMAYRAGIGLYSFFMRSAFDGLPDGVPFHGSAYMVEVKHDAFNQKVTCCVVTWPLQNLTASGPVTADYPAVKVAMEAVGLKNVNGPYGVRDWSFLANYTDVGGSSRWTNRALQNGNYVECDSCRLIRMTFNHQTPDPKGLYPDSPLNSTMKCTKQPGSNRCTTCAALGHLCSFSPLDELTVGPWRPSGESGDKLNAQPKLAAALFHLPVDQARTRPVSIPTPKMWSLDSDVQIAQLGDDVEVDEE